MKKIIKKIAVLLIFCLINTISPVSVFAADLKAVAKKVTPKQIEMIKNLSAGEKARIKSLLGVDVFSGADSKDKNKSKETTVKSKSLLPDGQKPGSANTGLGIETELSGIEKGFISKDATEKGAALKQFGYDVFSRTIGTKFTLTSSIPLGIDYRINPADKLMVTVWGNVNDTYALEVDERGTITIPKAGIIQIAGYSISEAKDILYQRLAEVYVADFNLDLIIKEIGAIRVYMVGNIKNPGAYTLQANTSLYDALFIGGGPTKAGTLRNVRLVRSGGTMRSVDLYRFIRWGNKKDDLLLKSGDVIHVPEIGNVVAISGNVKRPAIYELKYKTELSDFIGLAGGITPTSYLQRIQIERIRKNRLETAIDINYPEYLKKRGYSPAYLSDRDSISVFSIDSTIKNVVYLEGNVIRSGRYELEPNMKLSDLIKKADGLAPGTLMNRCQIIRLSPPEMQAEILSVDLNKMNAGDPTQNPDLLEFDRIRVFSELELKGAKIVRISGEINDGDSSFPLSNNMRVSDLIFQAGGLKQSAYLEKAELARTDKNMRMSSYSLDLRKVMNKDKSHDILLEKNDYLFIRTIPSYATTETVTVMGKVKYPGKYALYPGERLTSLVKRSGGFTADAFLGGAYFIRESLKTTQQEQLKRLRKEIEMKREIEIAQVPLSISSAEADAAYSQINKSYQFSLGRIRTETPGRIILDLYRLSPGGSQDTLLEAGDYLFIPEQASGVTVVGEVYSPGTILYEQGKGLNHYLNFCGGVTLLADKNQLRIVRASGRAIKGGGRVSVWPGDAVFVPSKEIKYEKPFDWNKFWATAGDVSKTTLQVVTSMVTVYYLYKSATK
ncbi:MAG: SLBB domain-containing protein [Candidatus Saganbacteria bacterium]|nr:SLBB domain-containing protein [Candidatus Saganbacteria bacterium]